VWMKIIESISERKLSEFLLTGEKDHITELIRFYTYEASSEQINELFDMATVIKERHYGNRVFFRALIEFSNYCKNDCYYCGLQRSNISVKRYRLSKEEIMACFKKGYELGYQSFVMQSGEDPFFTDDYLCEIIRTFKETYSDCALTLSIGERSRVSYKKLKDAGADRFLLRHETANAINYSQLHPKEMSFEDRAKCLSDLAEVGFQVGAGFLVEAPFKTDEMLAEDLIFLRKLNPHMVGIGPFVPHHATRFAEFKQPTSKQTLILIALVRIMLPKAMLPSTTALGTIDGEGREKGLGAGANVVMPNLTPEKYRGDYTLYNNKACTGWEAAINLKSLSFHLRKCGFSPDLTRGDHADYLLKGDDK